MPQVFQLVILYWKQVDSPHCNGGECHRGGFRTVLALALVVPGVGGPGWYRRQPDRGACPGTPTQALVSARGTGTSPAASCPGWLGRRATKRVEQSCLPAHLPTSLFTCPPAYSPLPLPSWVDGQAALSFLHPEEVEERERLEAKEAAPASPNALLGQGGQAGGLALQHHVQVLWCWTRRAMREGIVPNLCGPAAHQEGRGNSPASRWLGIPLPPPELATWCDGSAHSAQRLRQVHLGMNRKEESNSGFPLLSRSNPSATLVRCFFLTSFTLVPSCIITGHLWHNRLRYAAAPG